MIPLPRGIEEPASPWPGRALLGLLGALVVIPVAGVELGLAALLGRGQLGGAATLAWGRAHLDLAALGLVLLHFLLVAGSLALCGRGLAGRILAAGMRRLRARRLATLFMRHRKHLAAYFADGEQPRFVVEADPPGGGVPHRSLNLLLGALLGTAMLEVAAAWWSGRLGLVPGGASRHAALGLVALGLAVLLLGDLDHLRARLTVGVTVVALAVLAGLDPSLLGWGPGLVPAMALLLVALVVRATGDERATRVLFLTTKGVRLLRLAPEGIEDARGATLRPERLTLTPGNGESQWELWASGVAPLALQPLGGAPQEIAVTGALHGFPVRIQGQGGPGPLGDELGRQARPLLVVGGLLALVSTLHWLPTLGGLLARS